MSNCSFPKTKMDILRVASHVHETTKRIIEMSKKYAYTASYAPLTGVSLAHQRASIGFANHRVYQHNISREDRWLTYKDIIQKVRDVLKPAVSFDINLYFAPQHDNTCSLIVRVQSLEDGGVSIVCRQKRRPRTPGAAELTHGKFKHKINLVKRRPSTREVVDLTHGTNEIILSSDDEDEQVPTNKSLSQSCRCDPADAAWASVDLDERLPYSPTTTLIVVEVSDCKKHTTESPFGFCTADPQQTTESAHHSNEINLIVVDCRDACTLIQAKNFSPLHVKRTNKDAIGAEIGLQAVWFITAWQWLNAYPTSISTMTDMFPTEGIVNAFHMTYSSLCRKNKTIPTPLQFVRDILAMCKKTNNDSCVRACYCPCNQYAAVWQNGWCTHENVTEGYHYYAFALFNVTEGPPCWFILDSLKQYVTKDKCPALYCFAKATFLITRLLDELATIDEKNELMLWKLTRLNNKLPSRLEKLIKQPDICEKAKTLCDQYDIEPTHINTPNDAYITQTESNCGIVATKWVSRIFSTPEMMFKNKTSSQIVTVLRDTSWFGIQGEWQNDWRWKNGSVALAFPCTDSVSAMSCDEGSMSDRLRLSLAEWSDGVVYLEARFEKLVSGKYICKLHISHGEECPHAGALLIPTNMVDSQSESTHPYHVVRYQGNWNGSLYVQDTHRINETHLRCGRLVGIFVVPWSLPSE